MSKFDSIDVMKLYTFGSSNGWNEFLSHCYETNNINKLAKVKRELSIGMDNLAKQQLNSDDINTQFVRWVRSLEITAKKIIKKMHPMPTDTTSKLQLDKIDSVDREKIQKAKRERDRALQDFLRKSSF